MLGATSSTTARAGISAAPARHGALDLSGFNPGAALGSGLALIAGAALIGSIVNPRQALLYVLGAALGLVLYHAAFGFTSAWRVFIADRRGEGLRAQMVMLAIATALCSRFSRPARCWANP